MCNECENINHQFLPNLSFSLFPLLKLLAVWQARSFPSAGNNVLKAPVYFHVHPKLCPTTAMK